MQKSRKTTKQRRTLLYAYVTVIIVLYAVFAQSSLAKSSEFWAHRYFTQYDIAYGKHARQTLDIHQQGQWQGPPHYFVADKTLRPTLIYIHGGAWHGGNKASATWSLMPFIERGWQVVNLEYRVGANTAPQAADDILLAMQWLSEHGESYGIDMKNLVISGDSAGGHLALFAGFVTGGAKTHERYLGEAITIKAIINWFGISDIAALNEYFIKTNGWNYPKLWAGSHEMLGNIIKHYSPIRFVNHHSPAVISIHGSEDKVVPISQTEALHQKLQTYDVENKVVRIEGGRHLGFTDKEFQHIYQKIFYFLDKQMR